MDSPFRPLQRRRAFEDVILQVEEAIASGSLRRGDRLPNERQLAETLGVSRASVREALRVLEVFGVIVARPGTGPESGSFVSKEGSTGLTSALRFHTALSQIPLADFVDIRIVIERYMARRAASRSDPDRVARLRELIEEMRGAGSAEDFHTIDTAFHIELASASGNLLAPTLMEALRDSMSRTMMKGWEALPDWRAVQQDVVSQHEEIVDCVERGDTDGAEETLAAHIQSFYRLVIDHIDDDADGVSHLSARDPT